MKNFKNRIFFILVLCSSCTNNDVREQTNKTIVVDSTNENAVNSVGIQNETTDTNVVELKKSSAKFLWRKKVFDPEIKDSVSTIFINKEYCKTISDAERAAIAYVATFVGNDCIWDGDAKDDRSNLKCEILTALNLGYQCSETHLNYLRKWFKNDAVVLKELVDCPTIPYTATIQSTFEDISIQTTKDTIRVIYTKTGLNMRDGSSWKEHRIDEFKLVNGALKSGTITTTKKIF